MGGGNRIRTTTTAVSRPLFAQDGPRGRNADPRGSDQIPLSTLRPVQASPLLQPQWRGRRWPSWLWRIQPQQKGPGCRFRTPRPVHGHTTDQTRLPNLGYKPTTLISNYHTCWRSSLLFSRCHSPQTRWLQSSSPPLGTRAQLP